MSLLRFGSLALFTALFGLATGCDDHDHGHDHGHDHDHKIGHSHGPDDHDELDEDLTLWGESLQLFAEYSALVVGEASTFAVHLTRLDDHSPITTGEVVIELRGDQPIERFSVTAPRSPGIFVIDVKPEHPGPRQAVLTWRAGEESAHFDLGRLIAFASTSGARSAARSRAAMAEEEHDHDDEIGFLLEQQWYIPFRVDEVAERPLRPNLPVMGRLVLPPHAQSLIHAPRDGRLVAAGERFARVGDQVDAGSVLVALEAVSSAGADPAALDLAIERAELRVDAARREVERLRPLVNDGVVARRRLDEAQSVLDEALAEQRSARRQLTSFGQSQRVGRGASDALRLPTPISGEVIELFAAPGSWVTQGTPIARIVDARQLWLDVAVPEAYLARLRHLSGAWFRLDGYDQIFEFTGDDLLSRGSEVDRRTRTLTLRFAVNNGDEGLYPGLSPQVHLITDAPRTNIAIDASAIVDDGGVPVVFVQTGGESFKRQPVKLGIVDGTHVEILAGLEPGQWVVTRGAYAVRLAMAATDDIGHGHAH